MYNILYINLFIKNNTFLINYKTCIVLINKYLYSLRKPVKEF